MTQLMSETKLPTLSLIEAGQSPWLDFISRDLLRSGKLAAFISDKGLLGVTSNPSIFQKAITTPGAGYEKDIAAFFAAGKSTFEVYDDLTVKDIQDACDLFEGVFKKSKGEHGFVSLEVDPGLADNEEATVREGVRLFKKVARPNVMIKVPATQAGVSAFRRLIGQGINVNVTLMFSVQHYRDVARAYLDGLADLKRKKGDLSKVHSVASVFVSRFDTFLDKKLEDLALLTPDSEKKSAILNLRGKAAVANSKLIYQEFLKYFASPEFHELKQAGAWVQKLLWGSTSVKNPEYSDLLYVEPLVGRETVNTLPLPTFEAVLDHAKVEANTVEHGLEDAYQAVESLAALGFSLDEIGANLQKAGAEAFCASFDVLMNTIEKLGFLDRKELKSFKSPDFGFQLTANLTDEHHIQQAYEKADRENYLARLLKKDPTLWKNDAEHQKVILNRLGWLYSTDWLLGKLHEIDRLADELAEDKIQNVVLLGMGGSSLAPEVLSLICPADSEKKLNFFMLDTTDPSSILAVEKKIKLKSSVFIVASKSGGTVETMSQYQYFYAKVLKAYGKGGHAAAGAGQHFVAITDAGSGLQKLAQEKFFRRIFVNPGDIGGRYSALSFFGIVPAVLAGLPVRVILKSALDLLSATIANPKAKENPSIALGCILGALARSNKNKVTFLTTPQLQPIGAWLEQLIAESTGKEGKGIVPVESEPILPPSEYGDDRVFVALQLKGDTNAAIKPTLNAVRKAGYPVIDIEWNRPEQIGAEFLRWEVITAIASAVLGVNPFDEPNVKESKDLTGQVLARLEKTGKLPDPDTVIRFSGTVPGTAKQKTKLDQQITKWQGALQKGGYVAILAYTERSKAYQSILDKYRKTIAGSLHVPVISGFGPRYLHSIGQLYKGGPKSGLFIVFYHEEKSDIKVPETFYRFGQLKKAQALGDLTAIANKNLPVIAINLSKTPLTQLKRFELYLGKQLKKARKLKSKTR